MLSVLDRTITPTKVDRSTLIRAHYAFQTQRFLAELAERAHAISAHSQITPNPMWNHTAWLSEDLPAADALKQICDWHSDRNRRPVIYLSEEEAGIRESILAAGDFERFDEEAWMLYHGASQKSAEIDNHIELVKGERDLEEFTHVFKASFQIKEHRYDEAIRSSNAASAQEHFILRDAGRAVSVGTLIWKGNLGCIYNVGTPPAERKRGYAGRMMRHITARALELGCETIFLQVENKSNASRLYTKLGFETEFVRYGYRLGSWQPRKRQRTRLSNVLASRPAEGAPGGYLREVRSLDSAWIERLKVFSSCQKIGVQNILLAALGYLFQRYTGEDQVRVAFLDSLDKKVKGHLVATDRNNKVREWLAKLDQSKETLSHETDGAEFLLRALDDGTGHFQGPHHPLEISYRLEQSAMLEIACQSDLFSKDAIRRMASHIVTILSSIIENPGGTVADLEILSAREKNQLLVDWNQNDFVPTTQTLQELFEKQVERTPDAIALNLARARAAQPAEHLTYRQLNRKANKLAHRLQKLGVGPDVNVGVLLDRSLDMIVSLLAVIKAGGTCVPLDPAYPKERIQYIISDIEAPVLISNRPHVEGLELDARVLILESEWASISAENDKNPLHKSTSENAAYVIYTSGSTGQPKGVVISNYAIANHCIDCRKQYGLSSRDRILQFSSFHFDASFEQILPALISGATLVVRDQEVWNTKEFAAKLREFELTVADIPTAYWHELCDQWSAHPESIPSNNLRLVIVGGEAPSAEKLALWQATAMNDVRLMNAYGPTETTITATSFEVPRRKNGDSAPPVLPIGRPRADRTAYVLDRFGNPTPIGVPGELLIGGSLLASGYHNRNDLTAARFIQNPFSDDPEARLYKTGDLVRYLEDGNLEFLGRIDDQVKIRGYRIELGEIEAALAKYPGVREAIAMARSFETGEKRLVAYILKDGESISISELRNYLKTKLPDYMVPSYFVVLDQWPIMPNGKVDRRSLPEPADEAVEPSSVSGPRDSLELQLQLLFERVLKRAPIGIDKSFFELGGDSLQALELLVQIEKTTGKNLPLGTLYQSSTIETLAREVRERSESSQWSSMVPLQTSGKRPPFYLLHTTPGDILGYGNLVFHLPQDQVCYGFQSLGLKDSSLSHRTVSQMAQFYVDLLRKFQPIGPYYLGGWCYGGIVAIEMARLLQASGEKIGLLALFETVALPPTLSNWLYYTHRIRCSLKMGPHRLVRYVLEKLRYSRNVKIANRMRFRQAAGLLNADLNEVDPRLARLEYVYNANLKALTQYRSRPYKGRLTLFNAAERDLGLIPDPYYGWIGLADDIEIHEVPGNHDTMLTEPNVQMLAQKLDECLRRAQEQDGNK